MTSMKRAFTLFEVLLALTLVGILGGMTTWKFLDMKTHMQFMNDQKQLDSLLYTAQLMTILTDSESDVVLTREEGSPWLGRIEFSLPSHPLLTHISSGKTHLLSGIKTIQEKETGTIRIQIFPPFGETKCHSIEISSMKEEKTTCGRSLAHPLQEVKAPLIDEDMVRSLETKG